MIASVKLLILIAFFYFTGAQYAYAEQEVKTIKLIMGGTLNGLRNTAKQDAEISFNNAMAQLLKKYNTTLSIKVYDSKDELYSALDKGEIQGLFGTPLEFFGREQLLVPLMAVQYKGTAVKQATLTLVRADAGINQWRDLQNKSLALAKYQDVEELYLNTQLLKAKLPEISKFFSERTYPKNSNVSIMDVFFGRADVAMVRESEYKTALELNPQLGNKLKILDKSATFIALVGGASKRVSPKDLDRLLDAIVNFRSTENGANMLDLIQAEGLVKISNNDLNEVHDLIKENQMITKKTKAK